jgi:hypothetical protein
MSMFDGLGAAKMSASIEIRGLDKLQKRFASVTPGIKAGVKAATEHIELQVKKYPPLTLANQPKTYKTGAQNTWYQRGWGGKWALAGGGWHGKKSSEQLQQKWTSRMINSGLTGIVGNNASYAIYVMGERKDQAEALKKIGWKSVEDIAEDEAPTVANFITQHVEKALG